MGFSAEARTVVSTAFARNLRLPQTNRLLLITALPVYGTFSTLLSVEFSAELAHDVSLGLDWSSFFRESLILSGYRPGNAFDAATFLLLRARRSLVGHIIIALPLTGIKIRPAALIA